VPVVSQIVAATEDVPLLSLLLKLDMAVVREISASFATVDAKVGCLSSVIE
jgi:hypothetical protein